MTEPKLSIYNSNGSFDLVQTTLQECLRLRKLNKYIPPSCSIHFGKTQGYISNGDPWNGAPFKVRASDSHNKLQRRLTEKKSVK